MGQNILTKRYDKVSSTPGSVWSRYVYKVVSLFEISDQARALNECSLNCYVDRYPCNMFVHDNDKCYLMAWHVDSDLISSSSTGLDWYQRKSNVICNVNKNMKLAHEL